MNERGKQNKTENASAIMDIMFGSTFLLTKLYIEIFKVLLTLFPSMQK